MNESNLKIEKIQKSSKAALTVTNIVKSICAAGAVCLVVVGCITISLRSRVNAEFMKAIQSGIFTVEDLTDSLDGRIAQHLIEDGDIADALGGYIIATGAVMICIVIVLHFVSKVFKDFRESYSPFQPVIIKNLKITFVLTTIFALRSSLAIGLIIGFAAWCVINIFEYGCELQKQSDETL